MSRSKHNIALSDLVDGLVHKGIFLWHDRFVRWFSSQCWYRWKLLPRHNLFMELSGNGVDLGGNRLLWGRAHAVGRTRNIRRRQTSWSLLTGIERKRHGLVPRHVV